MQSIESMKNEKIQSVGRIGLNPQRRDGSNSSGVLGKWMGSRAWSDGVLRRSFEAKAPYRSLILRILIPSPFFEEELCVAKLESNQKGGWA